MQSIDRSHQHNRYVLVLTDKSAESEKFLLIQSGSEETSDRQQENFINSENGHGSKEPENVIFSSDIATETVISTSEGAVGGDVNLEDLRVPFMGQVVEVQEESSTSESSKSGPTSMTSQISNKEEALGVASTLTLKEIKKRERDRKYKQLQRQNPDYKAQERAKARQRMHNRRKDISYRTTERERDRARKKQVREENLEFRERERQRDREYKKQAKKSEKSKNSIFTRNYGSRFSYEDILSDSESEKCVAVRNCFQSQECESDFQYVRGSVIIPNDQLLSLDSAVNNTDKYSDAEKIEHIDITFSH